MAHQIPKFLSGRITSLSGPDFCQEGATHLLHAAHGILRLKSTTDGARKQLDDAATGGYDVIVAGNPVQGPECAYFRVYFVRPAHEVAETFAGGTVTPLSAGENDEETTAPEGSKVTHIDDVTISNEGRSISITGHVPSTSARVYLLLDGESPRKHLKYTVMYIDEGVGGDLWMPFQLVIRVPEVGNGATIVGDGTTVDVTFR